MGSGFGLWCEVGLCGVGLETCVVAIDLGWWRGVLRSTSGSSALAGTGEVGCFPFLASKRLTLFVLPNLCAGWGRM